MEETASLGMIKQTEREREGVESREAGKAGEGGKGTTGPGTVSRLITPLQTHPESHTPDWCGQSQTQHHTHRQASRDMQRPQGAHMHTSPKYTLSGAHT